MGVSNERHNEFYIKCLTTYYDNVDKIDAERKKGQNGNTFQKYLEAWADFNIIWGYYIYLDKETGKLELFTDQDSSQKNAISSVFDQSKYKDIPIRYYYDTVQKKDSTDQKELLKQLSDYLRFDNNIDLKSLNDFSQGLPPVYRTLCDINNPDCTDSILTYIPEDKNYKSYRGQNFYYILAEEVLFYIYSFERLNTSKVSYFDQVIKFKNKNKLLPNLSLAVNFALKLNAKFNFNINSEYITDNVKITEDKKEEGAKYLEEVADAFKNKFDIQKSENLQRIARFNIEASIKLLNQTKPAYIAHDIFVFPMVHSVQEETIYKHNDLEITNPLLFCAYIETLYGIKKDANELYENDESRKGFKVTEMICDHISKSLVETLYYGKIINKYRAKELVKAQKAAIMGRNMSHNIGSHVLYYLKNSLSDWQTMIDEKVLHDLIILDQNNNLQLNSKIFEVVGDKLNFKKDGKINIPFLYGLGKFINYLQERMDFIATISTDHLPEMSPVNFKDVIFDEFNYDLAAIRHKKDNSLQKHNILLNYIAKSEKYERGKIQVAFRDDIGLDIEPAVIFKNKVLSPEKTSHDIQTKEWTILSSYNESRKSLQNINISLPSGSVGRQAFFSILENIIRNACKHSKSKPDIFNFNINIIDPLNNEDVLLYNENISNFKKRFKDVGHDLNKIEFDYLICSVKHVSDHDRIDKLQEYLNFGLINDDLTPHEQYKGFKEIKISAAWIIRKQYSDTDLSHIYLSESFEGDKKYLEFNFLLCKPKPLFILSNQIITELLTENNIEALDEKSISHFKKILLNQGKFDSIGVTNETLPDLQNSTLKDLFIVELAKMSTRLVVLDIRTDIRLENIRKYDHIAENLHAVIYKKWLNGFLKSDVVIENDDSKNKHLQGTKITLDNGQKEFLKLISRTHLEGNVEFSSFQPSSSNYGFIESITGHNTTKTWYRDEFTRVLNNAGYTSKENIVLKEDTNPKLSLWSYQTIEAAVMKVAIIDERIFEKVSQFDEKSKTLLSWKNINVYDINTANIKNPFTNRYDLMTTSDSIFFDVVKEEKYDGVNLLTKTLIVTFPEKYDFVTIHQGLIDKVLNKDSNFDEWNIKFKYVNPKKEEIEFTPIKSLIHSGRSKPPKLIMGCSFLLFSQLEHSFYDKKKSLTDLLFNL